MDSGGRQRITTEVQRMPADLREHVERVRATSAQLAVRHGVDLERAELAALGHDICRITPGRELIALARDLGVPVGPIEEAVPMFLHGPVGAAVLHRQYGLDDEGVLDAIRCHTMGREEMTVLDKVLFLADKADPGKVDRYPFIAGLGRLAAEDLDRAMLYFLDHQLRAFIDHGDMVHPRMAAARNSALLAVRRARG